uniref:Uncharacterized protein n=1 Tax=Megaselia scalaris TaxID=36166 RepID=T1GPL0_MEGSC
MTVIKRYLVLPPKQTSYDSHQRSTYDGPQATTWTSDPKYPLQPLENIESFFHKRTTELNRNIVLLLKGAIYESTRQSFPTKSSYTVLKSNLGPRPQRPMKAIIQQFGLDRLSLNKEEEIEGS